MTAPDHREDNNGLVFPEADTDFLQNSTWQNFDSDAKDQSPKKPQRRVQRRNSMIETYTTDVFGTNILTEDPWADFGDGFNTDGKWRDASCRTTGTFSDSSEDDDQFPDSDPEGEEGTMPLQDHNRIERSRQGRRGSQGSKSSEDSSKRRNRSRSKASFVAGARRGRSLSVPRSAMDINETQDRPPSSPRRSVSPREALRLNRKFDSENPSSSKNRSRSQSRTRGSSQEEKKPRKSQTKEKSRKSQGEEKPRKTDRKSKSSGKQNEEKNKGEEKSRKADRKSKSTSKQLDDRSEHKSKSTSKQLDDRSEHKSKATSKQLDDRSEHKSKSTSKQLDDRSEHKSKSSSRHKDGKSERKSKSPSKLREDKIDRRSKSPTRNSGKRSERKSKSPTKYAEKSSERKSKSPLKQREERRGRRSKSPTKYAEGRSERKSKSPRRGRRSKSPTKYAEERLERKSKSPSRLAEDTSQKTEIKTKSPSQKENIPVSERKKNGQSLFAKPLPPKSYLSRGTQKRCYAGVSKEMNQRRSNIKSALANIFNDNEQEEESNHSTISDNGSRRRRSSSAPRRRGCRSRSRSREGKPSSADVGTKSEHSQRPRVKDRRLRRHSIIGASPSDVSDASDHSSRFESDCFSRPRSAESLLDNPRNTMPRTLRRNASIEPKKKRTYVFEV